MADILRPTLDIADLTRLDDKAREEAARKREAARKAAAARKDDRASLNLELALMIMFVGLVAALTLAMLGPAIAAKYAAASQYVAGATWGLPVAAPPVAELLVEIRTTSVGWPHVGITGAVIELFGPVSRTMVTDSRGEAHFKDLPLGTYTYTASAPGYGTPQSPKTFVVDVEGGFYQQWQAWLPY